MADKVDLVGVHKGGGYGSEFDYDSEVDKKRKRRTDLASKSKHVKHKVPSKQDLTAEYNKEEGRTHMFHFLSLDAYSRHKKMVNDYILYYGGSMKDFKRDKPNYKTDLDVIRENHKFLWTEEDNDESWQKRMAKKYYDKLFKEYCITDLSRYKENKVAMRWRTEKEVVEGKGQFMCGNKTCYVKEGLRSWEVNFAYKEDNDRKNALVKLRLCPDCSYMLNYHSKKQEVKRIKRTGSETTKRLKGNDEAHISESDTAGQIETDNKPDTKDPATDTLQTETPGDVWSGPAKTAEDKSRDEEFDEYFEDMFL